PLLPLFPLPDPPPPALPPLPLHDALPICPKPPILIPRSLRLVPLRWRFGHQPGAQDLGQPGDVFPARGEVPLLVGVYRGRGHARSEEHTSELQSLTNLVCRLLLEKKKHIS